MGLKKRNQVSAEFNMSSMTDIIFLLLIFFMLTSSIVAPNALNLKLPGSSTKTPPSQRDIDELVIGKGGNFELNGTDYSLEELQGRLTSLANESSGKASVIIVPKKGVETQHVAAVMDMARALDIQGILAMEPK